MLKLACKECGRQHKARKDKFPLELRDTEKDGTLGYLCKKCTLKRTKKALVEEYNKEKRNLSFPEWVRANFIKGAK